MNNDKVMKWLCLLIATGVWANVFVSLLRPEPVYANKTAGQSIQEIQLDSIRDILGDIQFELIGIDSDVSSIDSNFTSLTYGTCLNKKLCN